MKINYYALHYHMKSSGVRIVIENIFRSLSKYKGNKLNLLYSSDKTKYAPENKKIKVMHMKELSYDDQIFKSQNELIKKANKLKEKIKKRLDLSKECILHCHNVNLFKNSYLGAALMLLAQDLEDKPFTLLYQVHDFPEDHRRERLNLLMNCTGTEDRIFGSKIAYPFAKNIIYLTINSRDKGLLEKIGIPKERIFVFPNSIPTKFLSSKPQRAKNLLEDIEKYAKKNKYHFDKNRKILVYPVKIIRRKNIIESLLILELLNALKDEWQLLITLDAHSPKDKLYSEKIKNYIRRKNLPVVIGFGYKLISPEKPKKNTYRIIDLFGISDGIISTSRQEGFGFAFLEGWVANKKVVGRRIDFIFKDFESNGINLKHFYSKIDIQGKDFAKFNADEQLMLLENIDYKSLLTQEELGKTLVFIEKKNEAIIKSNKKKIILNYSIDAYAKRIESIIKKSHSLKNKDYKVEIDNKPLIDFFKNV